MVIGVALGYAKLALNSRIEKPATNVEIIVQLDGRSSPEPNEQAFRYIDGKADENVLRHR